jgi:hypothetical protein
MQPLRAVDQSPGFGRESPFVVCRRSCHSGFDCAKLHAIAGAAATVPANGFTGEVHMIKKKLSLLLFSNTGKRSVPRNRYMFDVARRFSKSGSADATKSYVIHPKVLAAVLRS